MRIPHDFTLNSFANFIVFEGVNGAGKSTLLQRAANHLRDVGKKCIETREPGGTVLGKALRHIVQEQVDLKIEPMTELYLFAADRYEHVHKVIQPAKLRGDWVLSDRFIYSTLAFQGYGRGVSLSLIEGLMEQATHRLKPDLVILVDLDPTEGLKRIASRNNTDMQDRFEREEIDFHSRVRQGFLEIAEHSADPFLVLDGRLSKDELFQKVLEVFTK